MQSRNRTPAILEPYLQLPPEQSLTLLTSTLGCTASWLTARTAAQALQDEAASVLLVSWMHDETFWRSQVKRLTNIADQALTKRFAFVDRLSESVLAPGRGTKAELEDLDSKLTKVLSGLPSNVLLILDMPDVLLATRSDLEVQQLDRLLMRLRSRVHCVVLSCIAEPPRSLEEKTTHEHSGSAFIIQQAHKARLIFSVRELETGSARDVSGILRITTDGETGLKEYEGRYLVQRDGTVKMD